MDICGESKRLRPIAKKCTEKKISRHDTVPQYPLVSRGLARYTAGIAAIGGPVKPPLYRAPIHTTPCHTAQGGTLILVMIGYIVDKMTLQPSITIKSMSLLLQ